MTDNNYRHFKINWLKQIRKLPLERFILAFTLMPVVLILVQNWLAKRFYVQGFSAVIDDSIMFFFFFFGSLAGLTIALMGEFPFRFPFHVRGKIAVFIGLFVFLVGLTFACLALYNIFVTLTS